MSTERDRLRGAAARGADARSSRPRDLAERLEVTLVNLTELAQEELEAWELSAMRDPRNWVRPGRGRGRRRAAPAPRSSCSASAAATASRKQQSRNLLELAERTLQDFAEEARRILPDR